jgi:DNA-nicking Smr family endonuclease
MEDTKKYVILTLKSRFWPFFGCHCILGYLQYNLLMARKEKPTQYRGSLSQLGQIVDKAGIHLKKEEKLEKKTASPPPPAPRVETDEESFHSAMTDVTRSSWRHEPARTGAPKPAPPQRPPELEDQLILKEAIEGEMSPMVQEHPEYIEGWVGAAGKRYLPNLRTGLYSIQEQLDLHGYNRVEARIVVEDFIMRMSRFQSCCVKIIHGRGINSPDDRAVLKENLQLWLCSRKMSRYMVAYASAQMNDGGVGAVYVLLKSRNQ